MAKKSVNLSLGLVGKGWKAYPVKMLMGEQIAYKFNFLLC